MYVYSFIHSYIEKKKMLLLLILNFFFAFKRKIYRKKLNVFKREIRAKVILVQRDTKGNVKNYKLIPYTFYLP